MSRFRTPYIRHLAHFYAVYTLYLYYLILLKTTQINVKNHYSIVEKVVFMRSDSGATRTLGQWLKRPLLAEEDFINCAITVL